MFCWIYFFFLDFSGRFQAPHLSTGTTGGWHGELICLIPCFWLPTYAEAAEGSLIQDEQLGKFQPGVFPECLMQSWESPAKGWVMTACSNGAASRKKENESQKWLANSLPWAKVITLERQIIFLSASMSDTGGMSRLLKYTWRTQEPQIPVSDLQIVTATFALSRWERFGLQKGCEGVPTLEQESNLSSHWALWRGRRKCLGLTKIVRNTPAPLACIADANCKCPLPNQVKITQMYITCPTGVFYSVIITHEGKKQMFAIFQPLVGSTPLMSIHAKYWKTLVAS